MPHPRSTHTFATLPIPAFAWDAIKASIASAGPEYIERYLHDAETILFAGSEVGMVRIARPYPPERQHDMTLTQLQQAVATFGADAIATAQCPHCGEESHTIATCPYTAFPKGELPESGFYP